MKKAGIAIDDFKQTIFERHLTQAGYRFETGPGLTAGTLLMTVSTENLEALARVVQAANTEAAGVGVTQ